MKKIILASLALIFSCFQLFAQEQTQEQEEKPVEMKYAVSIESGYQAGLNGWIGMEHVVVNGFRLNKQHVVGLGIGFGYFFNDEMYCPIYLNYRYYFTTKSSFTPHVNIALGGLTVEDGGGLYSTLTTGFRKHKFTLSTGIFFFAYQYESGYQEVLYDQYGSPRYINHKDITTEMPWGFMIKLGVAF